MPYESLNDFTSEPGDPSGRRSSYEQNKNPGRELSQTSLTPPETAKNIRELGPSGGGSSPEEEAKQKLEAEMAARNMGRESVFENMAVNGKTPREVMTGVRKILEPKDESVIPSDMEDPWQARRVFAAIYERRQRLQITTEELVKDGLIRNYDPMTGKAEILDRKAAQYAIFSEEKTEWVVTKRSKVVGTNQVIEEETPQIVYEYNFGKEDTMAGKDERKEMAKICEKAYLEMGAKTIIGEHIGVRLSLRFRDNLEGLADYLHETGAKFKAEHLIAIFNMPDIKELATSPDNHTLGDKVEEAMLCNLLMLNSGSKERMLNFMEKPGVKFLIAKMAKENNMNYDTWVKNNIGDINRWVNDTDRLLIDEDGQPATFRIEAEDSRRGKLTKWGNIAAFGGGPGDFGGDDEKSFIGNDVGGLVGSVEASWVAATLMRVVGAYASEGYVALPNGKTLLTLGEGRYISSDDEGKGHIFCFNMKEGLKGCPSGLKDMIGRMPELDTNLFDWAQVKMRDVKDKKGKPARRSIWDAWLGTAGGKQKIDLLTGKKTSDPNKKTTEEGYHRLGSLNFGSLDRDFHGTWGIMRWLAFRRDDGILPDALNVEKFSYADFSVNSLKKKVKYNKIVMNPITLTKGSTQLYDFDGSSIKTIQKNYFSNLMTARMQSSCFRQNVLPQTVPVFNESKGTDYQDKVSAAVLACMFVKAVENNDPRTQDELIKSYVDANDKISLAGGLAKAIGALSERKIIDSNLGRIVGKTVSIA